MLTPASTASHSRRVVRHHPPRIGLRLPNLATHEETDSVRRTNAAIRRLLEARYEIVEPSSADLVVAGGLALEDAAGPARLIFPHGALGDPGHWLLTVPQLRVCDTLAFSSSSDIAIWDRLAGSPSCAHTLMPLFVDTELFCPKTNLRNETRRRWNLPLDAPLLMTVSSIDAQKNVQSALLLLREIRRSLPQAQCAIVGDGDVKARAYLESLAQRMGIRAATHFLGPVSPRELASLYNAADLLVHLTLNRKENFGLVSVEAQASGLPVLAAKWGGVRDTLVHGETGYFADTYLVGGERRVDWYALVEPALRLLTYTNEREKFAISARRFAERQFSHDAFRRRLYEFIDTWGSCAGPERNMTTRTCLSSATHSLLVAFVTRALEHPEAKDSKEISDWLRTPHGGVHAYRIIHEQMASVGPPTAKENHALYRMVDAGYGEDSRCVTVHDPLWSGQHQLSSVQACVWNHLEKPQAYEAIHEAVQQTAALTTHEIDQALNELIQLGLVGCTATTVPR